MDITLIWYWRAESFLVQIIFALLRSKNQINTVTCRKRILTLAQKNQKKRKKEKEQSTVKELRLLETKKKKKRPHGHCFLPSERVRLSTREGKGGYNQRNQEKANTHKAWDFAFSFISVYSQIDLHAYCLIFASKRSILFFSALLYTRWFAIFCWFASV